MQNGANKNEDPANLRMSRCHFHPPSAPSFHPMLTPSNSTPLPIREGQILTRGCDQSRLFPAYPPLCLTDRVILWLGATGATVYSAIFRRRGVTIKEMTIRPVWTFKYIQKI